MRLFILLLLFYTTSFSHPHTFIEVKPIVEINDSKINKMRINWVLDEMTSMLLIMELDTNGNGKFEEDENAFIYENYFLSLSKYDFYMQILNNKKKLSFFPQNFQASIKNGKLIYAFDINKTLEIKELKISFFDKELFVGMMIDKESISLEGIDSKKVNQLKKQIFGVK